MKYFQQQFILLLNDLEINGFSVDFDVIISFVSFSFQILNNNG